MTKATGANALMMISSIGRFKSSASDAPRDEPDHLLLSRRVSIDSVTSGTSPTSPSACRSASVKPVDLFSLGSCRSSMPRLLVPVLEADIGFSSSEVSSSGMRPTFVTDQGRRAAPLLRARWPGIRDRHEAAPGDQVGGTVVAIDDAFD